MKDIVLEKTREKWGLVLLMLLQQEKQNGKRAKGKISLEK